MVSEFSEHLPHHVALGTNAPKINTHFNEGMSDRVYTSANAGSKDLKLGKQKSHSAATEK